MFLTRNVEDYISNKLIYGMRDTYYKSEHQKHEIIIFPIPLYLTISCKRGYFRWGKISR